MNNVYEWLGATSQTSPQSEILPSDRQVQWKPPTSGLLKCNVNASFRPNPDFIRVGWILRDENGIYTITGSTKLRQGSGALEAEGIAVLHALQSVWCRNYRNVIIEVDCKDLHDLFSGTTENEALTPLITDIRSWADHFSKISFTLVSRQRN